MEKLKIIIIIILPLLAFLSPSQSLVPYTRAPASILDLLFPPEAIDQFKILEYSPLGLATRSDDGTVLVLARADWRETPTSHEISMDVPGMKKKDIRIEMEDDRVVRISGEMKTEEEEAGDGRWHMAERSVGRFWRRFKLLANADVEKVSARLEDGVLRISVPKVVEEKKKEAKVISIVGGDEKNEGDQVVKQSKQEL